MRISDWSSDVCSSDLFRCQPIKRIVMKDKGHAVTAHLHVTFHAMPHPDCSVKGRAAVFYHPITVQATMREGLRSPKGGSPGLGRRRKEAIKPGEQRRSHQFQNRQSVG